MFEYRVSTQETDSFRFDRDDHNRESQPEMSWTLEQAVELRDGRIPESLRTLFEVVLADYPEMRRVRFDMVQQEEEDPHSVGYYTIVNEEDGECLPAIHLEETNETYLRSLFESRKTAVQINAELVGLTLQTMTPDLLRTFVMAHELGHIRDFILNYFSDPDLESGDAVDEFEYHRDLALARLPGKDIPPGRFYELVHGASSIEEAAKIVPSIRHHPEYPNLRTVQELMDLQEREYRSSPPEQYADEFAAGVIKRHFDRFVPQSFME